MGRAKTNRKRKMLMKKIKQYQKHGECRKNGYYLTYSKIERLARKVGYPF